LVATRPFRIHWIKRASRSLLLRESHPSLRAARRHPHRQQQEEGGARVVGRAVARARAAAVAWPAVTLAVASTAVAMVVVGRAEEQVGPVARAERAAAMEGTVEVARQAEAKARAA
jgi:hypothetical protein